jgi:hypothetical protein
MFLINHFLSASTLMTSFTSWKILLLRTFFCWLLSNRCKVDFMVGIVKWFLGVHFFWRISPSLVFIHLNQSGFASNLVESFFQEAHDASPLATPYWSRIPVDSIAPSMDADDSPTQICWTQTYQSLVGSIGWLAITTPPDLTAIQSFLSSYSAQPSVGHTKLALYALHYIHSTYDYRISFTSNNMAPMHSYIHYPPSTDVEAYTNAIPPKLSTTRAISAYSDACWGSQIGRTEQLRKLGNCTIIPRRV